MTNKTILFADDSATMRQMMQKTFAVEPYDVVAVPSGEAALQKLQEVQPSIVIADAGMMGMSGYDLCQAIRSDSGLAATPVVVMAGVSSPYDEARGQSVGVSDFIKKPFDTAQLIEKVNGLTEGAAAAPQPVAAAKPAAKPAAAPSPRPAATTAARTAPGGAPLGRPPIPPPRAPKAEPAAAKPAPVAAPRAASKAAPVAPKAPAASPETREFGRPAAVEPANQTFQANTLAELAQMDSQGASIPPEPQPDALEVPTAASSAEVIQTRAATGGAQLADMIEGLTPEQGDALRKLSTAVIEQVVWEVVPELAETIIREELARLLEE